MVISILAVRTTREFIKNVVDYFMNKLFLKLSEISNTCRRGSSLCWYLGMRGKIWWRSHSCGSRPMLTRPRPITITRGCYRRLHTATIPNHQFHKIPASGHTPESQSQHFVIRCRLNEFIGRNEANHLTEVASIVTRRGTAGRIEVRLNNEIRLNRWGYNPPSQIKQWVGHYIQKITTRNGRQ